MENPERWKQLAAQVLIEQDPEKLLALVTEMNDLLAHKQERLNKLRRSENPSNKSS